MYTLHCIDATWFPTNIKELIAHQIDTSNKDKEGRQILNYQLFVAGLMSYLRDLCSFAYSGVKHILRCVLALVVFVLCTLCCQCLVDCPVLIASSVFSIVYLNYSYPMTRLGWRVKHSTIGKLLVIWSFRVILLSSKRQGNQRGNQE